MSIPHCRSEEHTSELQSHRDLHSFPTRRSSDLREIPRVEQSNDGAVDISALVGAGVLGEREPAHQVIALEYLVIDADIGLLAAVLAGRSRDKVSRCRFHTADRKSTRLNSSHTEIYTLSLHDALPICAKFRVLNRVTTGL